MSYERLKRTKLEEVRAAIKEIEYDHKFGLDAMIGPLTDDEAKRSYVELIRTLPEVPGITPEEIKILTNEITKKINKIGIYVHPDYNDEVLITEEDFRKAIEKVHYEHRYDAGAMFETLSENEAIKDYNIVLGVLLKSELPEEVKNALRKEIVTKIGQIPKVEEEKAAQRKAYAQEVDNAFLEAKARFKKLSLFTRAKLRLEGKAPEQLNRAFMDVEDMNSLYRKR